jgi:hypothetical protein
MEEEVAVIKADLKRVSEATVKMGEMVKTLGQGIELNMRSNDTLAAELACMALDIAKLSGIVAKLVEERSSVEKK